MVNVFRGFWVRFNNNKQSTLQYRHLGFLDFGANGLLLAPTGV